MEYGELPRVLELFRAVFCLAALWTVATKIRVSRHNLVPAPAAPEAIPLVVHDLEPAIVDAVWAADFDRRVHRQK